MKNRMKLNCRVSLITLDVSSQPRATGDWPVWRSSESLVLLQDPLFSFYYEHELVFRIEYRLHIQRERPHIRLFNTTIEGNEFQNSIAEHFLWIFNSSHLHHPPLFDYMIFPGAAAAHWSQYLSSQAGWANFF